MTTTDVNPIRDVLTAAVDMVGGVKNMVATTAQSIGGNVDAFVMGAAQSAPAVPPPPPPPPSPEGTGARRTGAFQFPPLFPPMQTSAVSGNMAVRSRASPTVAGNGHEPLVNGPVEKVRLRMR